jgi:SRSO17 transposase
MTIPRMEIVLGHLAGGATIMIVTIPPRLESFGTRFHNMLSQNRRAVLPWILAGILLTRGKRTQSAIGREVLSAERTPGSVSRRMRRYSFRTRDMVRTESERQIKQEIKKAEGKEKTWFLAIDGVCIQRGSETQVENAIQYRKKSRGRKGRSTKAHTFVQGLVITASGARIPLPRRSYYTKEYVNRQNKRLKLGRRKGNRLVFKTQVDLARLIVKEMDLPDNIRLVVVADEYFEGKKMTNLCRKKGYVFIAPVDSRRTFEGGGKLHARGKALSRSTYQELVLCRGEEDTASHRRHQPKGAGEKGRRVYRFHADRQAVAGIGEAAIVCSWKRRRDRSGRLTSRETFKTLVCSEPTIPGETIIEWFEMRWPIEVFFRELKSELGLGDYQGTDFSACERHFDLVLLSFMFLEQMRCDEMARTRSVVRRRELACMRTSGLKKRIEREAHEADLAWFVKNVGEQNQRRLPFGSSSRFKMPA